MELSVQLQKLGLELELGWIPRGQNEEADDGRCPQRIRRV